MNLRALFAPGIRAVRKNIWPIMVVQVGVIALVVSYFNLPQVAQFAQQIGVQKTKSGLLGVLLSGAIAGGLLPELAKFLVGKGARTKHDWTTAAFTAIVYAITAVQVDYFYSGLAVVFGTKADFATVAIKTAVDMLIATPFVFIPFCVTMFEFWALGGSFSKLKASIADKYYSRRVAPTLVMAWAYWTPVLCGVYALPSALQFPLAMLAEAAFSMIVVFMNVSSQIADPAEV